MDNMQARLLRIDEVVELTGLSRAKAYAMVASGEMPSIRAGKSVRVPFLALCRWIEQNTTGGGADVDRPSIGPNDRSLRPRYGS